MAGSIVSNITQTREPDTCTLYTAQPCKTLQTVHVYTVHVYSGQGGQYVRFLSGQVPHSERTCVTGQGVRCLSGQTMNGIIWHRGFLTFTDQAFPIRLQDSD